MTREMWQEYDCPIGGDCDIWGDDMLYLGKTFKCIYCTREHAAGVDANVTTMVINDDDEMKFIDLPRDADGLRKLRAEYDKPSTGHK